jgi:hypothetical protein
MLHEKEPIDFEIAGFESNTLLASSITQQWNDKQQYNHLLLLTVNCKTAFETHLLIGKIGYCYS